MGDRLPQKVDIDLSMEEFEESLKPIPDGTEVTVRLKSIQPKGEKEKDVDKVVFEVVNNPIPEYNGKAFFLPLFTGNRKVLVRVSGGAFGWDENGYFEGCLDIELMGIAGIRTYTPEGSSEPVEQGTLKLLG